MASSVAFAVLLLVDSCVLSGAESFLSARAQIVREDVKQILLSELSGHASGSARISSIEEDMSSMYATLPKSARGYLEPATVRYALHRYFVHKHGWYLMGLDTNGASGDASVNATILKDRAPAYIQSVFEDHLHGQGFGLHELAVFAATLEDLVHAEATGSLEWIFAALGLPLSGPIEPSQSDLALHYMLVAYLSFGSEPVFASNRRELIEMERILRDEYRGFPETDMWLTDLRETVDVQLLSRRNPFIRRTSDFEQTVEMALEFGHHYGRFQNLECATLKTKLVDIEHQGSGRALLSTFYSKALAGTWEFKESMDYLRNQGVLDETNPGMPSVVIANYLNSKTNCLAGSGFYSVCCINECESLMGEVERHILQPSASPAHIAQVVSSVHSDTVHAPRNLSAALISRLDEIADLHAGLIPLHGRLFAQWMHHAYPRECPYPHVSGTTNPLSQEEWIEQHGFEGLDASDEVMQMHAAQDGAHAEKPAVLPWVFEEELVAENKQPAPTARSSSALHCVAALAALASFALPLMRTLKRHAFPVERKVDGHFV